MKPLKIIQILTLYVLITFLGVGVMLTYLLPRSVFETCFILWCRLVLYWLKIIESLA
jgi:hypothetical protein